MRKYQALIAAAVILLDRTTKLLVISRIPVAHEISIVPGLFQLSHWENTGAAFSIFADSISLCLILGGALGNLWDRLRQGTVTDFLDFYIGNHHWPPFNVADSAIVVGAVLLMMKILFAPKQKSG